MQLYLFRDPADTAERTMFMRKATRRSIKALRVLAIIALACCILLLSAGAVMPGGLVVDNHEEFKLLYRILLVNTVVFLLLLRLTKSVHIRKRFLPVRYLLLAYSLAVIAHFMGVSLLAQYNPSNTLTYLLAGCFSIAVLVLFSFREILFVSVVTYVVFVASLRYFQHDPQTLIQNYMTGFMIVLMMFFISRIWFSYQYDYYRQIIIIENKNRHIRHINMQQTEMLSIVAHDLRSPLNNISGAVDLLKSGTEAPHEFYTMIETACRDADYFIHDLIEVARNQPGPLQTAPVSIDGVLKDTVRLWQLQTSGGKHFTTALPDFPVTADVHLQKLQRALNNLIHNAVKFTPQGGTIKLLLNANSEMVHIAVADNGIGIPEDLMPCLFDRFTKAGRNGLNNEKSYGLGLSICKEIIEQHQGSIRVDSEENAGTTFHIILPRTHNQDQALAGKEV